MNVGDLVTVLPMRDELYLVIDFVRRGDTPEAEAHLGPIWKLYNQHACGTLMHEKYIEVIDETR